MTYQDLPQLDPATPGAAMHPTMDLWDRAWSIIDPHTGALIKRVSTPADNGWWVGAPSNRSGPYMFFGGSTKICANNVSGPGPGFLCSMPSGDGGGGMLYYFIPSTAESRFLGDMPSPYPTIDPVDGRWYGLDGENLQYQTYAGDYSAVPNGTHAALSPVVTVTAGVKAAIAAFDSAFVPADFGCGVDQFEGIYAIFTCGRGTQDSYGWLAVIDVTSGQVIAAMRVDANDNYHWTAIHHTDSMYDAAAVIITTHSMVGSGNGSQLGLGPYLTTSVNGLASGATAITVSGEPACVACGADPELPLAQPGDRYSFLDGTNDSIKLITKNSPTSWTISPTTQAHAPGAVLRAEGNYTQFVWKFLRDIHGKDATGTGGIVSEMSIDGHDDIVNGLLVMEGYKVRVGDLLSMAGQPWTRSIDSSPRFAGVSGQCFGNGCASHPSGAAAQPWFTDYLRWDGAYAAGGTITPVSGQVYKMSGVAQNTKQLPQAAARGAVCCGGVFSFQDVSGPGVMLDTTPAGVYKYIVANAPGEGAAGSSKGDVFFNAPSPVSSACGASDGACINNFAAWGNAMLQIGVDGNHTRVISGGLLGLSEMGGYPVAKSTADGSWLFFNVGDTSHNMPSNLMVAKLPPFAAEDTIDRTTFIRAPLSITAPTGQGIASATVEFWYDEQGGYCTSRRETCVATAATLDDSNPFSYATTDTYTRMPCATSCTITLPILPMHVAHYQVKFYDASGAFIINGISGVTVESKIF